MKGGKKKKLLAPLESCGNVVCKHKQWIGETIWIYRFPAGRYHLMWFEIKVRPALQFSVQYAHRQPAAHRQPIVHSQKNEAQRVLESNRSLWTRTIILGKTPARKWDKFVWRAELASLGKEDSTFTQWTQRVMEWPTHKGTTLTPHDSC